MGGSFSIPYVRPNCWPEPKAEAKVDGCEKIQDRTRSDFVLLYGFLGITTKHTKHTKEKHVAFLHAPHALHGEKKITGAATAAIGNETVRCPGISLEKHCSLTGGALTM